MDSGRDGVDLRVLDDLGMADEGAEEAACFFVVGIGGGEPKPAEPIHHEMQLGVFGCCAKDAVRKLKRGWGGAAVPSLVRGQQGCRDVVVNLVDQILHDGEPGFGWIEHGDWRLDHDEARDAAAAAFEMARSGESEKAACGESGNVDWSFGLSFGDEVCVTLGHIFERVPFIGGSGKNARLHCVDREIGVEVAGESIVVVGASAGGVNEEERGQGT